MLAVPEALSLNTLRVLPGCSPARFGWSLVGNNFSSSVHLITSGFGEGRGREGDEGGGPWLAGSMRTVPTLSLPHAWLRFLVIPSDGTSPLHLPSLLVENSLQSWLSALCCVLC